MAKLTKRAVMEAHDRWASAASRYGDSNLATVRALGAVPGAAPAVGGRERPRPVRQAGPQEVVDIRTSRGYTQDMEATTSNARITETIFEIVRVPAILSNGQHAWEWLTENSGVEVDGNWAMTEGETLILTHCPAANIDPAVTTIAATRDPAFHDSLAKASWPKGTVVTVIG